MATDRGVVHTIRVRRELSPAQEEVMRLTCAGLTAPQIGARLGMTEGRVRLKRRVAYQKLGVTNKADACRALERRDSANARDSARA